ncbi:MAG TPA: M24 family metallopeptidase [Lapillicoccus sp.]|jgi:antitoxin VapB|nr:M24 family metallopeptidase [Lapillicoccus sp.]
MAADYERWADLPEKITALADVGSDHGLGTVVLRDPANLTWLLGSRVNVPQTLDTACLDVVVDVASRRVTIVTNAIESPRLRDTELADLDADWVVVPWWETRDPQLPTGERVGSDRALPGISSVAAELAGLRRHLTGRQRRLLREVCVDAAAAATATAPRLGPGTTEYAAAGAFARELLDRELDPIVLLVAGAPRLDAHRHPLPTSEPLGRRAMLVACARRHGLVASVTRIVSFTPLGPAEHNAYERLLHVEQVFLDASRVGARLGDVVSAGCAAYATHGFDPEEWHRHHQGGFSGFQPRDFPAHRSSDALLTEGAVVAWNPSAAGWKVEDTTLVLDGGPEPLVHDDAWPTVKIGDRLRPDVLTPT